MPTFNQILKKGRILRLKKEKRPALENCPQRKGSCLKAYMQTPRKPNSALRKVARIILTNRIKLTAFIPGIGHNVQKHTTVLVRGGRTKDLPGLKYKIIRGALDVTGVSNRVTARSKYGVKRALVQSTVLK